MEKIFVPNHLHLLIKGYVSNPPREPELVDKFLNDLVERVRMKVVAGPTSVYVADPGNEGATGTVTLATSHASIHIWDSSTPSLFQFDIYSCSEFTIEEVVGCIHDHFGIVSGNYLFLDRNTDDFQEIESGTLS
jgi:S-adenosylmethionine/arginine decarboxylase-like enzyme